MRKSKVVYIDLDDVTADFSKAAKDEYGNIREERMFIKDFFLNLEPVPGAKAAVHRLLKMGFDVWILSQPFIPVPESYVDKALWVQRHFPQLSHKLILTQDKGLHVGDYLIDDNMEKWKDKFESNGGMFIHFPYGGYNSNKTYEPEHLWDGVVSLFKRENPFLD